MTEEKKRIKIWQNEFRVLTEAPEVANEDFEQFFEKQYNEYLIDKSRYLKIENKLLTENERLDVNGARLSMGDKYRIGKLTEQFDKLSLGITSLEGKLPTLPEEDVKKNLKKIDRLNSLKNDVSLKLNDIVADDDSGDLKIDQKLEPAGVNLTKEVFIEKKLYDLPKTFEAVEDSILYQTIKNYRTFLEVKKNQFATKNEDYLIDTGIVAALYNAFNTEKEPIWFNTEFKIFLTCFDIANEPLVKLSYKKQTYMVYMLSKIERVNNEIALSHFGIKSYKSQKSRAKNGISTPPPEIKRQIDKLLPQEF